MTPADLTPGVSMLTADPEQPAVTIVARTAQGGVRFVLGDQRWHWQAEGLCRALVLSGYEVAA
jgi:hypothetical protein